MIVERRHPSREPALAARLLEVQHAAYAVEARLIGDEHIPALSEDLAALVAADLDWLVADEDGAVLGALGRRDTDGAVGIDRLVVDPAPAHTLSLLRGPAAASRGRVRRTA